MNDVTLAIDIYLIAIVRVLEEVGTLIFRLLYQIKPKNTSMAHVNGLSVYLPWEDGECLKTGAEDSHPQLQIVLGVELS